MHHQSIARIASSLICPSCSKQLRVTAGGLLCTQCEREYTETDGIPVLIAEESKHKVDEAAYHSSISSIYGDLHQLSSYRNRFFHLRALQPLFSLPAGASILELGCGTGFDAIPLLRQNHLVVETDIAPGQVCEAKQHIAEQHLDKRALFFIADAERIPFANETFDAAFIVAAVRHLEDPAGALQEMARCTRVGGEIIIAMEPNRREWVKMLSIPFSIAKFLVFRTVGRKRMRNALRRADTFREPTTERTFTKRELRVLAHRAGLTIKRIEPVWFLCGFIQWLLTLLNKLSRHRWSMNGDIERIGVHLDRMIALFPLINSFCCNWTLHGTKK